MTLRPLPDTVREPREYAWVNLRPDPNVGTGLPQPYVIFAAAAQAMAKIDDPAVSDVTFLKNDEGFKTAVQGADARRGEATPDNPNGQDGTPNLKGGWRLFPDAKDTTAAERDKGRNIVRVRATLDKAIDGRDVYFRAFDVDDPSKDPVIDPNDPNDDGAGRDNRGGSIVGDLDIHQVKPAHAPDGQGYQGRLRAVGDARFASQGEVVKVKSFVKDDVAYAEAELLTSFAPGDNFRVVASTDRDEVANLNPAAGVKTAGDVAALQKGKATPQIAVWRRLNIEYDVMAKTEGNKQQIPVLAGNRDVGFYFKVPTNVNLEPGRWAGGILRAGAKSFRIYDNAANLITLIANDAQEAAPAAGDVFLYDDDWASSPNVRGNNALANTTDDPTPPDANHRMTAKTDANLRLNEYAGGKVRDKNGAVGDIVSNTAGPNAQLVIDVTNSPPIQPGNLLLFHPLTNDAPQTVVDTSRTQNKDFLFKKMQGVLVRSDNRFSDAYVQPDFTALDTVDQTDNLNAIQNLAAADFKAEAAKVQDTKGLATEAFWIAHVLTAFQAGEQEDADPPGEDALGVTNGLETTAVFMETVRDFVASELPQFTAEECWSRVAMHEVGHQFLNAFKGQGGLDAHGHRAGKNAMAAGLLPPLTDAEFYFNPQDVDFMRRAGRV